MSILGIFFDVRNKHEWVYNCVMIIYSIDGLKCDEVVVSSSMAVFLIIIIVFKLFLVWKECTCLSVCDNFIIHIYMYLYQILYLFTYIYIYLIYLYPYLFIYLPISISIYWSACIYIYASIYLYAYLHTSLCIYMGRPRSVPQWGGRVSISLVTAEHQPYFSV